MVDHINLAKISHPTCFLTDWLVRGALNQYQGIKGFQSWKNDPKCKMENLTFKFNRTGSHVNHILQSLRYNSIKKYKAPIFHKFPAGCIPMTVTSAAELTHPANPSYDNLIKYIKLRVFVPGGTKDHVHHIRFDKRCGARFAEIMSTI